MNENIIFHNHKVTKEMRSNLLKTKSCLLWFTGLSGSGKSTIAGQLEKTLHDMRILTYLLDGDNIRHGLNQDLGFSQKCRDENIRRASELSKLFVDAGVITIAAFISPFKKGRNFARSILEENEFIEVYINCPLCICEQRDPKGLYKKARSGEISEFTGINSPYEAPENPEITINTSLDSIDKSVEKIVHYLKNKGHI